MLGWLVLSVLLLVNNNLQVVSGCRSRSGEDSEREKVYSHKGTEPTWDKDAPANANEVVDDNDEDRTREEGEIKVTSLKAYSRDAFPRDYRDRLERERLEKDQRDKKEMELSLMA